MRAMMEVGGLYRRSIGAAGGRRVASQAARVPWRRLESLSVFWFGATVTQAVAALARWIHNKHGFGQQSFLWL